MSLSWFTMKQTRHRSALSLPILNVSIVSNRTWGANQQLVGISVVPLLSVKGQGQEDSSTSPLPHRLPNLSLFLICFRCADERSTINILCASRLIQYALASQTTQQLQVLCCCYLQSLGSTELFAY